MRKTLRVVATIALTLCSLQALAQSAFHLKPHDTVMFYGDSITEDGRYGKFVETFVVTRFPKLDVKFVSVGVGGDRVTGGWMGPIDVRLKRDVYPYHPTVITIMLGMNDGSYRLFDQGIFDTYSNGYRQIVANLKANLPGVRLTLIQPSPFDDVTRKPTFEGGYNSVLLRYSAFVAQLAGEAGATVADMNTPVVDAVTKAVTIDPAQAAAIIKDRVHPGAGGHLVMARALLKAWNAPSLVSDVAIDAATGRAALQDGAAVSEVRGSASFANWTQLDRALPMPFDTSEPTIAMVLKTSDVATLNRERVVVSGLKEGRYALKIDGKQVGAYSSADLAAGVEVSALATPMLEQAREVARLTEAHRSIFQARWRSIVFPLGASATPGVRKAMDALTELEAEIVKQQRAAAQPRAHRWEVAAAE